MRGWKKWFNTRIKCNDRCVRDKSNNKEKDNLKKVHKEKDT